VTVVAAFDCGTNTIKVLVADLDPVTGKETDLVRESRIVRLGQGVDRTGRLDPEAIQRTFDAIDEYAALMAPHDPERIRFCATSASRDASNAEEFVAGVRARLGVEPEVISGHAEAQLAYDGATRGVGHVDTPVLVIDIGGGSTELILGEPASGETGAAGRIIAAHSLDIGSVRMHERLMPGDPPSRAEIDAATAAIDVALDTLGEHGVDPASARSVIGVAGTITTVGAAVLDLAAYDRDAIHGAVLERDAVHAVCERLLAMTVEQRRALPFMHPGRADVIGAGALILDCVLRRTSRPEMLVSEADILDGTAWSLVG
jgi:exopolyphosphatase/guanosine-5'-triphosphate,3'-diphosphate pyrophosphatase